MEVLADKTGIPRLVEIYRPGPRRLQYPIIIVWVTLRGARIEQEAMRILEIPLHEAVHQNARCIVIEDGIIVICTTEWSCTNLDDARIDKRRLIRVDQGCSWIAQIIGVG